MFKIKKGNMSFSKVINCSQGLYLHLNLQRTFFERVIKIFKFLYEIKHYFLLKLIILNINGDNYILFHLYKLGDKGIRKCSVFNYAYILYLVNFTYSFLSRFLRIFSEWLKEKWIKLKKWLKFEIFFSHRIIYKFSTMFFF